MSARRSKQQNLVKKYGKMAEQYQDRIDRQTGIIDRLVQANTAQGNALWMVENDAKSIREARKVAKDATAEVKKILAVPNKEENDG